MMNHSTHSTIYQSINPYTQKLIQSFPTQSIDQVQDIITELHSHFAGWARLSVLQRLSHLSKVITTMRQDIDSLATLISLEMGKPITAAKTEIEKCITLFDYYQANAEHVLKPEHHNPCERVIYQPSGTILGILPWNYPFWQVLRFAIPTLISGNTVLIKHAPNVTLCAKAIEALCERAGLPILKCIFSDNRDTEAIIKSPAITGISVTGSDRTGSLIASLAGKYIKPCILELGGMDPFIVLKDAKMPDTATAACTARCTNSGQVCINAKRFIVHNSLIDQFIATYIDASNRLIAGNPIDPTTTYGPLSRKDIFDTVMTQLKQSQDMGATPHVSSIKLPNQGYFIPPTLLTNVTPDMPILSQEVFGPIAPVIPFTTQEEAIQIANNTPYGLGASIWTQSEKTAEDLIPQIEAGCVYINKGVTSLINLPFGGIKKSGVGRELGRWGLTNFCTIKTVVTQY
jgi:acyl-CoA reductase-like NAD-dependent aldehyde dehydrogenase